MSTPDPRTLADHLTPERMAAAQRHLVTKAIAELSHERVLRPEADGDGWFWLDTDDPKIRYRFRARLLPLDHWLVEPATVTRLRDGVRCPLDAQQLVLDLRDALSIDDTTLPVYLEEIASTLAGRAWKARPDAPTSSDLLHAGFQEVEAAMTEGHPCFVANNGRLGLGASDYLDYAPETARPVRLVWLAVRRERSVSATVSGLGYEELLDAELGAETLAELDRRLRDLDLDPADYRLMPCHPWQWDHKIAVTFAPDVARRDVVCLGAGDDDYQAQQSVRTFYNRSRPDRHYVKTALSVLNMGFMRGLSPGYMASTPPVNDWVHELVTGDRTLRSRRFSVLREVAAVGYHHEAYERAGRSAYGKMLSALWRESPVVEEGERLVSMTSLLHVDAKGTPYVAELVAASGLQPADWLRRYLEAYLVPVVHCFHAHRLVFMPHGENVILALRDHVPVRAVMKDIGEEVAVLDADAPLPPDIERIRADVPEGLQALSIFTDVFDSFLRFLAALLDDSGSMPAASFWQVVSSCLADYEDEHPGLADRFAQRNLFAPEFPLSCLNRLQLRNNREMVDLADPASALAIHGRLANPLAASR